MTVEVSYYILKEDKKMNDGAIIQEGQRLLMTSEQDGLLQFMTCEDSPIKRIFWAWKDDVVFCESISEEWTEEMAERHEKELFGNWISQ